MSTPLETPALIRRKRDGEELSAAELQALITAYLAGDVSDAQLAALLMAGVINGFSEAEAIALTEIYVSSGQQVDLSILEQAGRGPTVDKHSTGGVGDTTTLVVGPIVAACGLQLAKLSGRGLGHTGGTLDKLEAIPGFRVDLRPDEVVAQVASVGLAVAAATADLVPADKRIYALRDVTGTVASPALIAASVMSKKLAGGAQHILLDVKTGEGAFIEDLDDARRLAELCVRIGESQGRRTAALLTDMSQPLGDAIGNALEVAAAVHVLQGHGSSRLAEVSFALAAGLLELTGAEEDAGRAEARVRDAVDSGAALERFREFVSAQGGDPSVADEPWEVLPSAPVRETWHAPEGHVAAISCTRLGELAARLGAGRLVAGASVDPAVGLEVHVRVGDPTGADRPAVTVHARSAENAQAVTEELPSVIHTAPERVEPPPLIHDRVGF